MPAAWTGRIARSSLCPLVLPADVPDAAEKTAASPSITISMTAQDYVDMTTGKLNGQVAFMSGKLRIAGDMGLALRMQSLFA